MPEQQRVEKDARIARANAEREARDAEVTSRQQIAERERDLSLRQAQLKAETDKAQADTDSTGPIARAAKEREIAIKTRSFISKKSNIIKMDQRMFFFLMNKVK